MAAALAARRHPRRPRGCSLTGGRPTTTAVRPDVRRRRRTAPSSWSPTSRSTLPKKLVREFEEESGYDLEVRAAGDAGDPHHQAGADRRQPDRRRGVRRRQHLRVARARRGRLRRVATSTLPAGAEAVRARGRRRAGRLAPGRRRQRLRQRRRRPGSPSATSSRRPPSRTSPTRRTTACSSPRPRCPARRGWRSCSRTVAEYGDDWPDYWERLLDNGALVVDGWTTPTTASSPRAASGGTRPIVLSYDSSPAFTVPKGDGRVDDQRPCSTPASARSSTPGCSPAPTTPRVRRRWSTSCCADEVQAALPTSMYVFPVVDGVELPADWATVRRAARRRRTSSTPTRSPRTVTPGSRSGGTCVTR